MAYPQKMEQKIDLMKDRPDHPIRRGRTRGRTESHGGSGREKAIDRTFRGNASHRPAIRAITTDEYLAELNRVRSGRESLVADLNREELAALQYQGVLADAFSDNFVRDHISAIFDIHGGRVP